MMVTLGQVTGFAFLYTFGGQVIQRVQWLSNRLEALDLSRYQNAKWKITASAAVLGLPPVTLLSLAGRGYETRRNFYLLIVLAGRFLRFLVIAGAPALFVTYFGPWRPLSVINCVAGLKESVLCKRITRAIAYGEMVENTDFNQRQHFNQRSG